jgi:hypothetical protein
MNSNICGGYSSSACYASPQCGMCNVNNVQTCVSGNTNGPLVN